MPDASETIDCSWCGAENNVLEAALGIMGPLAHYRCRHCGGDFARTAPIDEATEEAE